MAVRLNLCCGFNKIEHDGFVNVDMLASCEPDVLFDLETFPWPWEDSAVEEVRLYHALEHLGQAAETYLAIMKELYRVCRDGARIVIDVPHPAHDNFTDDPTHVRAVTPTGLALFSKRLNRAWIAQGQSNTPLGLYLDVDFELTCAELRVDPPTWERAKAAGISLDEYVESSAIHRNMIREIHMELRVVKGQAE